jgi:hypothetical protein
MRQVCEASEVISQICSSKSLGIGDKPIEVSMVYALLQREILHSSPAAIISPIGGSVQKSLLERRCGLPRPFDRQENASGFGFHFFMRGGIALRGRALK